MKRNAPFRWDEKMEEIANGLGNFVPKQHDAPADCPGQRNSRNI